MCQQKNKKIAANRIEPFIMWDQRLVLIGLTKSKALFKLSPGH
uniref:Uncharacterized protein n=1 Tax=Rhizophora mucronata TaxID=61149 RepID=A0A2P2PC08_RHIMU